MSLIKIIVNDIQLDVVKETLTIVKENNALISEFKISYSNVPFLIVENANTKKALGSRDMTSRTKPKIIPALVQELGVFFYGEIQILAYLEGYRKVTLKYATKLLTIMDKKIADFMPIESVIPNETNPIPFSEISDIYLDSNNYWKDYPIPFLNEKFPIVKFQFPTMFYKNKFGVDLDNKNTWFYYNNYVNEYDINGKLICNTLEFYSVFGCFIKNKNIVSPQIFLLSPLFYALKSIGFIVEGSAYNDEFIKSILFYSEKDNLTSLEEFPIIMSPLTAGQGQPVVFYSQFNVLITSGGTYTFNYSFDEISFPNNLNLGATFKIDFLIPYVGFTYFAANPSQNFSGSIVIEVDEIWVGNYINISYFSDYNFFPNHSISMVKENNIPYYQMHPTIKLGRYVPDWTFGTYLNELKKLFNLKIDIDDVAKKVSLNFNDDILLDSKNEIIKKSLAITTYEQQGFDTFHLKFQNDIDSSLWITKNETSLFTNQQSNFLETLESKFKIIPNNQITANITDEIVSKDGVGLMIYNPEQKPFISTSFQSQTLQIDGDNGIYNTYWRKWLKFRLRASHVEMTGYFTEIELAKITKVGRIYIDHQEYLVASLEYSETEQSNFEVNLVLESITF